MIPRVITNENYEYVDTQEALVRLCDSVHAVDVLAIDTEADSLHNYQEKTCLIQVTYDVCNVLIDPLAGVDLAPFLAVIKTKTLVMHGGDYDLRMLFATYGYKHEGAVFDTMPAAQLLGHDKLGLQALVERYCGVVLCKAGQKTDWSKRPLTDAQIVYARDDTRYLLSVAADMRNELEEKGRVSWHQEMCDRMIAAACVMRKDDNAAKWRVKGSGKFTSEQYAYLKRLWQWREAEAERADWPPFKIMRNGPLCDIAVQMSTPNVPLVVPEYIRGNRLKALKQAIAEAKKIPESEWPPRREFTGDRKRMTEEHRARIDRLRESCRAIAQGLEIEVSIFAPFKLVQKIVLDEVYSREELQGIPSMMQWQAALLSQAIARM